MRLLIILSWILLTVSIPTPVVPEEIDNEGAAASSPPRSYLSAVLGELPPEWEQRTATFEGQEFVSFYNNLTNETRVRDPRLQIPTPNTPNRALRHSSYAIPDRTILKIHRETLFESAFSEIMTREPIELRKKLEVNFQGEPAIDQGGVSADFFGQLGNEIANPAYALFEFDEAKSGLLINPASGLANPAGHLFYFQFIGRVLGLAIYHSHFVDATLVAPYYKVLLGLELDFSDLVGIDPQLHKNLQWMQKNSVEDLDLNFSVEVQNFGSEIEYVDLKENGKGTPVNDTNKGEFLKLFAGWKIVGAVQAQLDALKMGFNEIMPAHALLNTNPHQLEMSISGLSKIDVDDWEANTEYHVNEMSRRVITWFWKFARTLDDEGKSKLLQFVTGSSRVPLHGFKNLQPKKFNLFLTDYAGDTLPSVHTCFNRADIPRYSSYREMAQKLSTAISETAGFGQA